MSNAFNPSGNDYHFGGAIVTFQRQLEDGTFDGQRRLGNVSTFNVTTNSTVSEHMSSYTEVRELDLSVTTGITRTLAITLDNFGATNWALHELGEAAIKTVAGVTGKTDTILNPVGVRSKTQRSVGYGYRLGETPQNPNGDYMIDFSQANAPVVKQGATTLVEGDDYYFDTDGLLTFISGSAFLELMTATVTYATISDKFEYIVSGSQSYYGTLHVYEQLVVGKRRHFRFPYVQLTPTGEVALISDAIKTMAFEGRILRSGEPAVVIREISKVPTNFLS